MVKGYWEPHSSSIDFCETNYLLSDYVVEVHNTWSSILGLSLFGVIGLRYGNPTKELRFSIAYIIFVIIGLGSAGLHGTLHWVFQSSDELPMVYLLASYLYIILELEGDPDSLKYPMLPFYLLILMMINSAIYYTFQEYYWVFLISFTVLSTSHIYLMFKMMLFDKREFCQNPNTKLLFTWASISYVGVATPVWFFDMLFCQWTLDNVPSNMFGITAHVLWHFTAGFGGYCTIVCLESCRMNVLHRKHSMKFLLGVVPIVIDDGLSTKASKQE